MVTFLSKFLAFCIQYRWPATVAAVFCWTYVLTVQYTRPEATYQGSYQVTCPGVQPFTIEMYQLGTRVEYTSEGQGIRYDFSQCKMELLQ